jgi:hypothetical protein
VKTQEEIKQEIAKCDEDIAAWQNLNKHLWKRAYVRRMELVKLLDKELVKKPKPVEKLVEKKYDATDVNKDGKTDLSDIIEIGKKIIGKKSVKKSIKRKLR